LLSAHSRASQNFDFRALDTEGPFLELLSFAMGILINLVTIIALLLSIFMVLVILMQRGNAGGGLGAAMGGGMAESALGADTSNVLSRLTRNVAIAFFALMFGLYLAQLKMREVAESEASESTLPDFGGESQEGAPPADLESILSGPDAPDAGAPSEAPQSPGAPPSADEDESGEAAKPSGGGSDS